MTEENQHIEEEAGVELLAERWEHLNGKLRAHFHKEINLEGILFLIGVRELGQGVREFTKEEKRDLMHIAICAVLAPSGYYELSHQDQDGWPHWEVVKELPFADVFSQEVFLKSHIVDYFASIYDI